MGQGWFRDVHIAVIVLFFSLWSSGCSLNSSFVESHLPSLGTGFGNFAAAQIAQLTAADGGGEAQVMAVYSKVGQIAVLIGAALIIVSPLIKRMMHLDTLDADTQLYNEKHGVTGPAE